MVHSVMAVPTVGKLKRDDHESSHSGTENKESNKLFAAILEETVRTHKSESAPTAYQTTFYDRERRLHDFHYLTREYHY